MLPDELVVEILDHLVGLRTPDEHVARGLCGLSRVSRRLHHLATPYLYSIYSFYHGHPFNFLHSISTTPALAAHVKAIHWDHTVDNSITLPYKRQSYQLDRTPTIRKLRELGTPCAEDLVKVLPSIKDEAAQQVLDAVLMFTPNLDHLIVSETFRWDGHVYWFRPILQDPHRFGHLKSAFIHGPMRIENIAPLLTLPSMRQLHLTQIITMRQKPGQSFEWEAPGERFREITEKNSSPIEHLHLLASFLRMSDLKWLLRAFQGLKSFVYEQKPHVMHGPFFRDAYMAGKWSSHRYMSLSTHLDPHKHSLEYLRLEDAFMLLENLTRVLSREPFENLRTLHVAQVPCYAIPPEEISQFVNSIPASLESLRIVSRESTSFWPGQISSVDIFERALYLIAKRAKEGELPNLMNVAVVDWHPWHGTFPPDVHRIKSVFAEASVQFDSMAAVIEETKDDISYLEDAELGWLLVEVPEGIARRLSS